MDFSTHARTHTEFSKIAPLSYIDSFQELYAAVVELALTLFLFFKFSKESKILYRKFEF